MAIGSAPTGVINTYATLASVKARAAITSTTNDSEMWMTVHSASRVVDRHCNRHFFVVLASRAFDVANVHRINIPDLAVIAAISEDRDGDRVYEVTRDAADYLLWPANAEPQSVNGVPYNAILADPYGVRPDFPAGFRRVQITGEWGYRKVARDSGTTLNHGGPLSVGVTSVTVANGTKIASGQTLLLESEQMFIRDVATDLVTVERGVNGTSEVTHVDGITISICEYPAPVVEATTLIAARLWKRKDIPLGDGLDVNSSASDSDITALLGGYRRIPLGSAA
ncbi:MAG: hypothetical protein HQ478_04700 [Chloroflexi bacterium]|nr:hypothetical protein [Chloroflexota bacterium]